MFRSLECNCERGFEKLNDDARDIAECARLTLGYCERIAKSSDEKGETLLVISEIKQMEMDFDVRHLLLGTFLWGLGNQEDSRSAFGVSANSDRPLISQTARFYLNKLRMPHSMEQSPASTEPRLAGILNHQVDAAIELWNSLLQTGSRFHLQVASIAFRLLLEERLAAFDTAIPMTVPEKYHGPLIGSLEILAQSELEDKGRLIGDLRYLAILTAGSNLTPPKTRVKIKELVRQLDPELHFRE